MIFHWNIMLYLLFWKKNSKIWNCWLLQIIGGALWVKMWPIQCDKTQSINNRLLFGWHKRNILDVENYVLLIFNIVFSIAEEKRMEQILPSGNIAVGLVFNYFVGFLRHVLPSRYTVTMVTINLFLTNGMFHQSWYVCIYSKFQVIITCNFKSSLYFDPWGLFFVDSKQCRLHHNQ